MNQELLATAYHEAGHAVISEELGIKTLHIIPDAATGNLGCVRKSRIPKSIRPDFDISLRVRDRLEREIMVSLAGCLAEQKFTGNEETKGAEQDHHNAVDSADYLTGSPEETDAYLAWLLERTRNMIEHRYWIIEAVAAHLYEHRKLTGDQLRECIKASMLDPRRNESVLAAARKRCEESSVA